MAIPNTTFRAYIEKLGATEAANFIGNEVTYGLAVHFDQYADIYCLVPPPIWTPGVRAEQMRQELLKRIHKNDTRGSPMCPP